MLLADTLVVIGLATVNLGTIQEADGPKEHTFWLRNSGDAAVTIRQGYTSCGCTTIHYAKDQSIAVGDSAAVTLRFDPRGKGGEFEEMGTIVFGDNTKKRTNIALVGTCITSEETLMRQFPIRISDQLRLSTNRFDLGRMRRGETKERYVVVLHRDEQNRKETIVIRFTADGTQTGLQHIAYPIKTREGNKEVTINITLDVLIS